MANGIAEAFLHDAISGFLRTRAQLGGQADRALETNLGMAWVPEGEQVVNRRLKAKGQAAHGVELAQNVFHLALDMQRRFADGACPLPRLLAALILAMASASTWMANR